MGSVPIVSDIVESLAGGQAPDTSGLDASNKKLQQQLSATRRADLQRRSLANKRAGLGNNAGLLATLRTALPARKQETIGA